MRLQLLVLFVVLIVSPAAWAGDYMVELFEEHYKEMVVPGLGELKINHTWQVKTAFGNKVLILVGNDYNQRKWLRQYKRGHKLWVVKVPDEGDDRFKYNMAVY
ncbi:MAG: hypothetical protein GY799_11435, partial [Desulfobulbaceae bacterium]|nr:hypothetical protein [Desulfobulbaceae bacterium]